MSEDLNYPSENKNLPAGRHGKKIFLRVFLLCAVFLVSAAYLLHTLYPDFFTKIIFKNPAQTLSNNNQTDSLAENPNISLIGGGTEQIINSQTAVSSDSPGYFQSQLDKINSELEKLKEKPINYLADKLNLSGGEITGELEISDKLTLNDTAKTEDLIPKSDDKYDLGSEDKGFNNAYIHQLWGSSILTIGDDDTSHNLSNNDDVLISGDLEVNSNAYFDGNLTLAGTFNAGNNILSNLADPISAQDAVTKAYYEANTPTGVFSRSGTTISPTTAGDAINFTNSLLTFDSTQTFGGSTLTKLGYIATASSDIQVQITGLDTDKEDSLTKGDITAGAGISLSGDTTNAVIGSGVTIATAQNIATSASPTFAGLTVASGGIDVTGDSTFNDDLDILGGLDIAGTLGIGGDTLAIGDFSIQNSSTTALTVGDGTTDTFIVNTTKYGETTGARPIFVDDGIGNLKIGSSMTGEKLTEGYNTILGRDSARFATTAKYNLCLGRMSCEGLTTGRWNVMGAAFSGADTTIGDGNTQFGGHSQLFGVSNSFNSVFGFEAGAAASYSSFLQWTGEYNNFLGPRSGPQGHTAGGSNLNNLDHVTLVGYGATVGNQPWIEVSALAQAGSNVQVTTSSAHGYSDGDYVFFRDFDDTEIMHRATSCALSSLSVHYFKVTIIDTTKLGLQWCRSADGATNNWSGETCGGWNDANWTSTFVAGDTTVGFSSSYCTLDDTKAFVMKLSPTTLDRDFATCIGANCVATKSNSVTLGRKEDDVLIPGFLSPNVEQVTLTENAITPTMTQNKISAPNGTTDLNTINSCPGNGTQNGRILILSTNTMAGDVTLKNLANNIIIGADFTLNTTYDRAILQCTSGEWVGIALQNNLDY